MGQVFLLVGGWVVRRPMCMAPSRLVAPGALNTEMLE